MLPTSLFLSAALIGSLSTRATESLWTLQLLPMPQRCKISASLAPPGHSLILHLPATRSPVAQQIAEEAAQLLGDSAKLAVVYDLPAHGVVLSASSDAATLFSRWASSDGPRVRNLPNASQAYVLRIIPSGRQWRAAIVVAADDPGMYYGYKTLKQLLQATLRKNPVAPSLTLPQAEIVDWPDMPERGEWGNYALADIDWLTDRKMNLIEVHASLTFDNNGRAHASLPPENLSLAQRHAVKLVPIITHLDQLRRSGIFKYHPEVRAQGKEEDFKHWGTILLPVCWAKPEAVRIMTQWMEDLARIPQVNAITVWLSEDHSYCHCSVCSATGQFVMETRAALQAWRAARKIKPGLQLRILLTQGSYKSNEAVLKEVPIGEPVGVIYYHGDLTYMPYKRPMIEPYMAEFTKRGGWLGVCPMLGASWRIVSPFSCPQFIHQRMQEFHNARLKCLYAYATPGNRWWDMNVQAAAEWAWNRDGRDIAAFARAWGARRGLAPDLTARWVATLGPASWDIYSARVPYPWFFGSISAALRRGTRLQYGSGPFQSIPSPQHMQADLRRAHTAAAIARKLAAADLVAESRTIGDYLEMLQTLKDMSDVLAEVKAAKNKPSDAQRARLTDLMTRLDTASRALVRHMQQWAAAIAPASSARPPSRFLDTVTRIQRTVSEVSDICVALGAKDPGRPYRWHKIGSWKTEDFDRASPVTREIDVTAWLSGPGTYQVRFAYTTGLLGLVVTKVELLAVSPDGQAKTVAIDEHKCHAGAWNKGEVYSLHLAPNVQAAKFAIRIVMSAGSPHAPREERTSNGEIFFRKVR